MYLQISIHGLPFPVEWSGNASSQDKAEMEFPMKEIKLAKDWRNLKAKEFELHSGTGKNIELQSDTFR